MFFIGSSARLVCIFFIVCLSGCLPVSKLIGLDTCKTYHLDSSYLPEEKVAALMAMQEWETSLNRKVCFKENLRDDRPSDINFIKLSSMKSLCKDCAGYGLRGFIFSGDYNADHQLGLMLHELGHILGIKKHLKNNQAVMNERIRVNHLSKEDIKAWEDQ